MRHVYIHVPFCHRRCVYCDFAIAVRREVPSAAFVQTVLRELERRLGAESKSLGPVDTLYVGGGTPSLLDPRAVDHLISGVLRQLETEQGRVGELTLEANPDDVTPPAAQAWAAAGVNRVSLGAQSFDAQVLAWMHRTHRAPTIEAAVEALRATGIASVSLDLIFGLPEAMAGDFPDALARTVALNPEHVSVYGLTVEPRTPLGRRVTRGATPPPLEERYEREFLLAHDVLTEAGFEHYEVSNYAKPGHRAIHNSCYWTGAPYLGLGPSAHTFSGVERSWNIREWADYHCTVSRGDDATAGSEELDAERRRVEQLYLELRTADGVHRNRLDEVRCRRILEAGELQAFLEWEGDRMRLTPRGWLRLDEVIGALTTSADGG